MGIFDNILKKQTKHCCRQCEFVKPNDGKVTTKKHVSICGIDNAVIFDSHKNCCKLFKLYR